MVSRLNESIQGNYVVLQAINTKRHSPQLLENLKDPNLWIYFPIYPYNSEQAFESYINNMQEQKNTLLVFNYTICSKQNLEPLGFLGIDTRPLQKGEVEIVNVIYSPKLQKTTAATEAIYLILKYCFERLMVQRVKWRARVDNKKSINAAIRFGFVYQRQQMDSGYNFNCFFMNCKFWKIFVSPEYERWLRFLNFDASGNQKTKLKIMVDFQNNFEDQTFKEPNCCCFS